MESILDTKESKGTQTPSTGSGVKTILTVIALLVLLGATVALFVQFRAAKAELLARVQEAKDSVTRADKRVADLDVTLAGVRAQTKAVADRVGVTEKDLNRAEATARQIREEQQKGLTTLGGEVGQVKEEVAAALEAIEKTQAQLQRAIGDLGEQSGLIARNADELAQLKHSTARDYFEFDLRKVKQTTQVGPVAIRLKGADQKRNQFTLTLVVDDMQIEKKDKTLLEPVQFYRKGGRQLHEIVVFTVEKDRVVGYVSTPKAPPAAK